MKIHKGWNLPVVVAVIGLMLLCCSPAHAYKCNMEPIPTTCGVGACTATGVLMCVGDEVWDTCTAGKPSAEDCNGIDDDCNGTVDDGLTRGTACGVGACASTGIEICVAGAVVDLCQPWPVDVGPTA